MNRREFVACSARGLLGLSFGSVAGCAGSGPDAAERGSPIAALIDDLEREIPRQMSEANVPGVSVAVIQNARVVWRRGMGFSDVSRRAPVDPATVFQAASMSKPVFAYAALKLCEQGVIELDRPLTSYGADPFLVGDPRLELITPRMLLSHSSGLSNVRSRKEPLKINFPPGTGYRYSGEGYYYLQSIITHLVGRVDRNDCGNFEAGLRVCATDIGDFLQRQILIPFGMSSSCYVADERIAPHLALGHDENGNPIRNRRPDGPTITRYAAMGALLTTPTDYAKFLIEVLRPRAADAFRLSEANVREMLRPQIRVLEGRRPSAWALGWQLQDNGLINHGGDNRGFHCHAIGSPKTASGLVVMTNGENGWKIIPALLSRPALAPLFGIPVEAL